MKQVNILQEYYLTAHIVIEVPDDYTEADILNAVQGFPINATIESMFDEDSDLNEIKVTGLSIEQLITGHLPGDLTVLDENGRNILL